MAGLAFVISAPSGGGKTTLINTVLARVPGVARAVTVTTRAPRAGEQDGHDYHFHTDAQFDSLLEQDRLIEHATVYGTRYGVEREALFAQLLDHDVLLALDTQGMRSLRAAWPATSSIFLLPPSMDVLHQRLTGRAQDSADVIARRTAQAEAEIEAAVDYDYLLLNDDLDQAAEDLSVLIRAERLRQSSASGELAKLQKRLLRALQ